MIAERICEKCGRVGAGSDKAETKSKVCRHCIFRSRNAFPVCVFITLLVVGVDWGSHTFEEN
jgi:hypothetical protein